jgi:hypothetical protein
MKSSVRFFGFTLTLCMAVLSPLSLSAQRATVLGTLAAGDLATLAQYIDLPSPAGEIAVGETIEGEINPVSPTVVYTFEATEGDAFSLSGTFDGFEGFLFLYDEANVELTGNDSMLRIPAFIAPADGTYRVVVTTVDAYFAGDPSFVGGERPGQGTFQITLNAPEVVHLSAGEPVEGDIADTSTLYLYTTESPTLLDFSAESEDFDTLLDIRVASQGYNGQWGWDDDNGDDTNSHLRIFAPAADMYLLTVSSFDAEPEGSYTLTASVLEPIVLETETAEGELIPGEGINLGVDVYTITGAAGGILNVNVEAASEDTELVVEVYSPDGEWMGPYEVDANGYSITTALKNLAMPVNGNYLVVVWPAFSIDAGEGAYTLTVEGGVLGAATPTPSA